MNLVATFLIVPIRVVLVAVFVLAFTFSFAQCYDEEPIDTLMSRLKTAKDDENKVDILNSLSWQLNKSKKYTETRKYAEEALALAEKLNYKRGISHAYAFIGHALNNTGQYADALKFYVASFEIIQETGDKKEIATANYNLGFNYSKQHNYPEAIKYLLISLQIRKEIEDRSGMEDSYDKLGIAYRAMANFPEALKAYYEALKIKEETGDKMGIAFTYNNIGVVHKATGNYAEALKYYLSSLKIKEELGDEKALGTAYNNIGNMYILLNNLDEALQYHMTSLKYREQAEDTAGIAWSHFNIGTINEKLGKYVEAMKYCQIAVELFEKIEHKIGLTACYSLMGNLQERTGNYSDAIWNFKAALHLSDKTGSKNMMASSYIDIGFVYIKLQNYDEAKQNFKVGFLLAKETGIKDTAKKALQGIVQIDSLEGNFKDAFIHLQLYNAYKDSLFNETTNQQITQLKEQYESEKKDKEILELTNEKQFNALFLKLKEDSLNIARADKDRLRLESEKIRLENETVLAFNLYNQQLVESLGNEKRLQQLQIEKDKSDYAYQKSEADKKQEQLIKEKDIQELQLKKERLTKNYFIAGMGLFLVLSFFIYRNYRSRQEVKLLSLRNKIASDLHDDIGSTLSSISIFSQMTLDQSKEAIPALETIGESSRKMLDAMADIVWTINPENDQFEKVIMRMRGFAFDLLGAKDIDFDFETDDDISNLKLSMEARKNLYLIFKEATNNMAKYAEANKALITIKEERDKLTMLISDNGKGFDISKEVQGNGLRNMKKRAIEIGAQLFIDSIPGAGTTIKLELAV